MSRTDRWRNRRGEAGRAPRWAGAPPHGFGLRLVFLAEEHREAFKAVRERSRSLHAPWEVIRPDDPAGDAAFEKQLVAANSDRSQRMLVFESGGDEILGQVTLSLPSVGPPSSAYAGYWTSSDAVGRGVATRALALALDHAFNHLTLHRVEVSIQPNNAPSLAAARRLGFTEEGLARKLIKIAGVWRDHLRFSMLEEEWPEKRAEAAPRLESYRRPAGDPS